MWGNIQSAVIFQPYRSKEFYKYIKEYEDFTFEEKTLIDGYCKYIKKVCSINDFTKVMKFDNLNSLYVFNEFLLEICSANRNDYSIEPYDQIQKKCGGGYENGVSGLNFTITYKKCCLPVSYGWIGIYYLDDPEIYIAFYDNKVWAKTICDLFSTNVKDLAQSEFFEKPFKEDSRWWIKLSTCKYEEFQKANTVEDQKKILNSFLENVIDLTIQLKAKDNDGTNI